MLRMRPNLADLYLTLAPATRSDYQKTLANALLVLVPISVVTALAYTTLGIVLVHAAEPGAHAADCSDRRHRQPAWWRWPIHLIGPEGTLRPRPGQHRRWCWAPWRPTGAATC